MPRKRRKVGRKATKIFTVSLPENYEYLLDVLYEKAKELGISRSELIARILAEYFGREVLTLEELMTRLEKVVAKLENLEEVYQHLGRIPEDLKAWLDEGRNIKKALEEREDWLRKVRNDSDNNALLIALNYYIRNWEERLKNRD